MNVSRMHAIALSGLLVAACADNATTTPPTPLRIISANPVAEALHEIAGEFARQTGHEVTVVASGTDTINQLLESDEPADVVVGTPASVDAGIAAGQAAGPKTDVARVGIGIIVREGAPPAPDVANPEAVRRAALEANGVVFNTAGSGRHIEGMFGEMGIGDEVAAKSARPGNAAETMDRMMNGLGMEIGFGLLSEIRPYEGNGIELIGRLPEELQGYTRFEGIVLERSVAKERAREFLNFLATEYAREAFQSMGVD